VMLKEDWLLPEILLWEPDIQSDINSKLPPTNPIDIFHTHFAGRDLTWGSGALYPDGSGLPYPGLQENMFVGRTSTIASSDLAARRTGGPSDITFEFTEGKVCYDGYSSTIAAMADTTSKSIEWSALIVTCNDMNALDNVVSLTPADFAQFTYTTLSNCNFQSRWYINIRGTDDVVLTGGSFPGVPGGVVYNVIGSRTVNVHDTQVNGAILATNANLNQTGGVIVGKVVAGNVAFSLQINMQNTCPVATTITIPSVVNIPSIASPSLSLRTNVFVPGDFIQVSGDKPNLIVSAAGASADGSSWVYNLASKTTANAGAYVYTTASTTDSRAQTTQPAAASSASAVAYSFALIAAIIALAF